MLPHSGGILLDIRNQFEYDIGHFDKVMGCAICCILCFKSVDIGLRL